MKGLQVSCIHASQMLMQYLEGLGDFLAVTAACLETSKLSGKEPYAGVYIDTCTEQFEVSWELRRISLLPEWEQNKVPSSSISVDTTIDHTILRTERAF